MMVLLWKILFLMIIILFCCTHYVVGGYAVEVLCCNWTLFCVFASWKCHFYYLFILIIMFFWLMLLSLSQIFLRPIYLFYHYVSWYYRTMWVSGVPRVLVLLGCYLSLSSDDLTSSSHICGSIYKINKWAIKSSSLVTITSVTIT